MNPPEKEKLGFLNILIIILSIYVLLSLLVDTFFKLPIEISKLLFTIDNGICFVFLLDFSIRFYRAENKLKFMKWGWIDLVSSIPSVDILRAGRLLRLIRLLRVLRAFRSTRILVNHVFRSRVKGTMTMVTIISFLIIVSSSISILIVENVPESNIKTSEDAIWWAMTTITTVGYGDRYPVTTEGRLIAVVLMVTGVGLFGVFTGYISSIFVKERKNENHKDIE
jgi:voltage-gated potassium channel